MKAKAFLFSAVFALLSLSAAAQDNELYVNYDDNWFIGAGTGLNLGLDGQAYDVREYSHLGAGLALDVYFGRFFNDWLGFRAGYQGLGTSNHYTNFNKDRFGYVHADALFRLGITVPYVHAGALFMNKVLPAGGVGLMLPIRLTGRVNLVPDIKSMFMSAEAFADGLPRLGYNLTATIGIQVKLGKI